MMPPIGGRDEVWRGSLQLTFINFEIQFCGYFMLDLLVIAIVTIPIPTIYGTCNEVHSLDARAGSGVHMGHFDISQSGRYYHTGSISHVSIKLCPLYPIKGLIHDDFHLTRHAIVIDDFVRQLFADLIIDELWLHLMLDV